MDETKNILILCNSSGECERGLLTGIAEYAHLNNCWIIHKQPFDAEISSLNQIISKTSESEIDAVFILWGLRKIIENGMPVMASFFTLSDNLVVHNIIENDSAIFKIAIEHLIDCGLKNFGYYASEEMEWSVSRSKALERLLKEYSEELKFYSCNNQIANRKECISNWVEALPKPVGVVCCNDEAAIDVMSACKKTNLNVPDEVAIMGIDDDKVSQKLCNPSLSSVALNFKKAGFEAAEMLDGLIRGKRLMSNKNRIAIEPLHVASRASTDVLKVEDKEISKAIAFIRKHADKPIQARDVIESTTVSRRDLYKRFRKILGRGVSAEIRRIRINKFAQMLLETDFTVSEICDRLNMCSDHISRYFKDEKKVSPTEYRKNNTIPK